MSTPPQVILTSMDHHSPTQYVLVTSLLQGDQTVDDVDQSGEGFVGGRFDIAQVTHVTVGAVRVAMVFLKKLQFLKYEAGIFDSLKCI